MNFQTLYFVNRKGARVVVDGSEKNEARESAGPVRPLYLTSDLIIGKYHSIFALSFVCVCVTILHDY